MDQANWVFVPIASMYAVSDFGGLRSYVPFSGFPSCFTRRIPRVLKPYTNPDGYRRTKIVFNDGKLHDISIHQLVMIAFVGPCPEGLEVCHNNGNPGDNRLSNLRYDTPKANSADAIKHGTTRRGEKSSRSRISDADAREVIRLRDDRVSRREIADRFGISVGLVSKIHTGKNRQWTGGGTNQLGFRKLKEADIPVIHDLGSLGLSYAEIGKRFGVTGDLISMIISGKAWKRLHPNANASISEPPAV